MKDEKQIDKEATHRCPKCMSLIHPDAKICPYCHKTLKGIPPLVIVIIIILTILCILWIIVEYKKLIHEIATAPIGLIYYLRSFI